MSGEMNDLVQIRGAGFGVEVRTDRVDQLLPMQLVLWRQGEQLDQLLGLTSRPLRFRDQLAPDPDVKSSKKLDGQCGCAAVLHRFIPRRSCAE